MIEEIWQFIKGVFASLETAFNVVKDSVSAVV